MAIKQLNSTDVDNINFLKLLMKYCLTLTINLLLLT